ncbi:MAG TPA: hypothetical protein VM389_05475 [Phycisphaerae bacterium]|nr:hypothetical protein [Phycisphaerae bacterium]HUU59191.1 hypothetical protein [Phycisphaerae bacterium]
MRTPASERWAASLSGLLEKQPTGPARGSYPGGSDPNAVPEPDAGVPPAAGEPQGRLAEAADAGEPQPAASTTINVGEDYEMVRP